MDKDSVRFDDSDAADSRAAGSVAAGSGRRAAEWLAANWGARRGKQAGRRKQRGGGKRASELSKSSNRSES